MPWVLDVVEILIAIFLILLNGFFVAAEFALVKVRGGQISDLVSQNRPFARTAQWLTERMESVLSACQLGITMASLALGWIGEPAFAHLLAPMFTWIGITSSTVIHSLAFVVAFTAITSLHLVIGEQTPKIYAIRRADLVLLWCALPMKFFYVLTYPLMAALNWTTSLLLARVGLDGTMEHDSPHSEEEIRTLVRQAHVHGELSRAEHRLINAVFKFDDTICRRVMVPRCDVEFFDLEGSIQDCLKMAAHTKHTRYPVCTGSLDKVHGVVHVKDLVGLDTGESFDWFSIMRPPHKVPENLPISKLLRHFQSTHQLLAFVIDEYGMAIGIVTLENVLEQIIGPVDDEFDLEEPDIVSVGPQEWIVRGSTPIEDIHRTFFIATEGVDVDTFSGFLTCNAQSFLKAGDRVLLGEFVAEVLEVRGDRAFRVRVSRSNTAAHDTGPPTNAHPTIPPDATNTKDSGANMAPDGDAGSPNGGGSP